MHRGHTSAASAGLVGLLALSAGAWASLSTSPSTDEVPGSVPVPTGHVGDIVSWVSYELESSPGPLPPRIEDVRNAHDPLRAEHRLVQTGETLTGAGTILPALLVESTEDYRYWAESDGVRTEGVETARLRSHVDFASRNAERWDFRWGHSLEPFATDQLLGFFSPSDAPVPGFQLQGRTLAAGDDLAALFDMPTSGRTQFTSIGSGAGAFRVPLGPWLYMEGRLDVSSETRPSTFDVRTVEATVQPSVSVGDRTLIEVRIVREWVDHASGWVERSWYSEHSPYPVVIVTEPLERDSDAPIGARFQESYAAGTEPIPWTNKDPAAVPLWDPEGTPPVGAPPDGAPDQLAFPLSLAIQDTTGLGAPTSYAAWSVANPGNALVSATMTAGPAIEGGMPTIRWRLVIATPDGRGIDLSSERATDSPVPFVRDHGPLSAPAWQSEMLLPALASLSAAQVAWTVAQDPAYEGRPVSFIHWGLALDEGASHCVFAMTGDVEATVEQQLRTLYLGDETPGSCVTTQRSDSSILVVDIAEPRPVVLVETHPRTA